MDIESDLSEGFLTYILRGVPAMCSCVLGMWKLVWNWKWNGCFYPLAQEHLCTYLCCFWTCLFCSGLSGFISLNLFLGDFCMRHKLSSINCLIDRRGVLNDRLMVWDTTDIQDSLYPHPLPNFHMLAIFLHNFLLFF